MTELASIITIGICPSWDLTCRVDGIDWGRHERIDSRQLRPAGKALNISRALAWLGTRSTAAGLWGQSDYQQMLELTRPMSGLVDIAFTTAQGSTRQNITIVDTSASREMHLRAESKLADAEALDRLMTDLDRIVTPGSLCVFAGAMPEGELLQVA